METTGGHSVGRRMAFAVFSFRLRLREERLQPAAEPADFAIRSAFRRRRPGDFSPGAERLAADGIPTGTLRGHRRAALPVLGRQPAKGRTLSRVAGLRAGRLRPVGFRPRFRAWIVIAAHYRVRRRSTVPPSRRDALRRLAPRARPPQPPKRRFFRSAFAPDSVFRTNRRSLSSRQIPSLRISARVARRCPPRRGAGLGLSKRVK